PVVLRFALRVNMKNIREYVGWLYYQYLLMTGIYVLEPWEKSIFNTVLFTMVAMVIYTSYVFVPIHVRLAMEFFSGLIQGERCGAHELNVRTDLLSC
ncbi:serine palmitoyltransferase small subunit B, partial [Paramisgurnus dabryanus]|uniref:serine palmitoyltransferase small subunit B n=1 Tax=Paramisgurnus dabryanus TaxID=90735 RepID=UPI0031F3BA22